MKSLSYALIQHACCLKKRTFEHSSIEGEHVKAKRGDSPPTALERGLQVKSTLQHPDLGSLASRTVLKLFRFGRSSKLIQIFGLIRF